MSVERESVADKRALCEGTLPFEVVAGRPTEFSISSDNLNDGTPVGKVSLMYSFTYHKMLKSFIISCLIQKLS